MNNVKKFLFTIVLAILLVTLSTYVFAADNIMETTIEQLQIQQITLFLILHKQLAEIQKLQYLN